MRILISVCKSRRASVAGEVGSLLLCHARTEPHHHLDFLASLMDSCRRLPTCLCPTNAPSLKSQQEVNACLYGLIYLLSPTLLFYDTRAAILALSPCSFALLFRHGSPK